MNFEVSDFFLNIELRNPKANQFQPVQKSRQQALIAYFSYMYTRSSLNANSLSAKFNKCEV